MLICFMFDECSFAIFLKGDPEFLLGIHYYGAVPCNRFSYWLSGQQPVNTSPRRTQAIVRPGRSKYCFIALAIVRSVV
jgi:hypothetical protein